jgi:tetratricopeptide (TPR) repeat protein
MTLHLNSGDASNAVSAARALFETTDDANLKLIADAARLSIEAGGTEGDLDRLASHFREMATGQRESRTHHFGVTMLNLALISILQDDPVLALAQQDEAIQALEASSASIELSSAYVARAATLAQMGSLAEADRILESALSRPDLRAEPDLLLEAAEYQDSFGDPGRVGVLLDEARTLSAMSDRHDWARAMITARRHLRERDYASARRILDTFPSSAPTNPSAGTARLVLEAHLLLPQELPTHPPRPPVHESLRRGKERTNGHDRLN